MTPPIPLVDTQLERMFLAGLVANPAAHDLVDIAGQDFGDFKSLAIWTAFGNLRQNTDSPTADQIRDRLCAEWLVKNPERPEYESAAATRNPDGSDWLDQILSMPLPRDPPLIMWSGQLIALAESRREAITAAEPIPAPARKAPRGPRAENTEPVRLAEAFRRFRYEAGGEPTLVRWARAWWRYDGTRYVEHDDELLDRDLIGYLDVVVAPTKVQQADKSFVTELRRVTSKNKTINEVRKALALALPIISGGSPQWTSPANGDAPSGRLVAVSNGLLDVDTLELHPPSPRFFATSAIGTRWDPDAPPPTAWLAFLDSLWGEDREAIRALQQIFGYLLTADTSQQKLFAIIGPPRSGKGTVARVLRGLLGDAVVNPTLKSMEDSFGLAPLVGKTVAIIGDARLGGPTDQAQVVERLLSISGEDALSINRKNRDAINVQLVCRVLLLSNELPRLYDTSGALASRFVILCLSRSFLGSEDTQLEGKLLAELPGILRWAVDGRTDLHESGRFVVPASSAEAFEHLREISSPHSVFFEEAVEFEAESSTDVDDLYARYKTWCEASGREPENKQMFGRNLHTLFPEIRCVQYRKPPHGRRSRKYLGLKIVA
jgi:putative DNA primase/helicase